MEQDTQGAIGRDIIRTFYQSFEHSQGRGGLQFLILEFAAPIYRRRIEQASGI